MSTTSKRKHAECARLASAANRLRNMPSRPTVRAIAEILGVSYWCARHYIAGECKAEKRLGR